MRAPSPATSSLNQPPKQLDLGWLRLNGSEGKPLWIWAVALRAVEEVADGSVVHVEGIESLVATDKPEDILRAADQVASMVESLDDHSDPSTLSAH